MKWIYMILRYSVPPVRVPDLNFLGEQGWELVLESELDNRTIYKKLIPIES